MFIRDLNKCKEFIAGDGSVLRELLHPDKADLGIRFSLAEAKVGLGEITKAHRLKTAEVYYILEGEGLIRIDDESSKVYPGCAVYVPPNSKQHIRNTGKSILKFICIVDPAWKKEDEEVL
ncbi:cupin domain-containing protein [Candidatus Omnitrophota bacterium]